MRNNYCKTPTFFSDIPEDLPEGTTGDSDNEIIDETDFDLPDEILYDYADDFEEYASDEVRVFEGSIYLRKEN